MSNLILQKDREFVESILCTHIKGWNRKSIKQKDLWRMTYSEDDMFLISRDLLNYLGYNHIVTKNELEKFLEEIEDDEFTINWNKLKLLVTGIGNLDKFVLNELIDKEEGVLAWKTLHDYAKENFLFQQQARVDEYKKDPESPISILKEKPFEGELHGDWIRISLENKFYYGTIYSLSSYILSSLDIFGMDLIDKLLPNKMIPGKNHGKRQGDGIIYDMRSVAGDKTQHLGELRSRYTTYLNNRCDELHNKHINNREVYFIDTSEENDPHLDIIFGGEEVMKDINFQSFIKDCKKFKSDVWLKLDDMEKEEKSLIESFIQKEFEDIMKNFDPKVIKLKPNNKVIILDSVLDKMGDL